MKQFAFILGHNPTLSVWELTVIFTELHINFQVVYLSKEVLVIEVNENISPQLIERLGGTVKIVEIIDINGAPASPATMIGRLGEKSKVVFGFSLYSLADLSRKSIGNFKRQLDQLGIDIKRELKNLGRKARFVSGKDLAISSSAVNAHGLLLESGEWVWLADGRRLILGKTISVQKSGWYSWRDYGRPARDPRSGMLPPKLAKILVNLSGIDLNDPGLILDPFCGSGTVLQEAGILGFKNLLGTDRDPKALANSQKNWDWLKLSHLVAPDVNFKLKLAEVRFLEPSLGTDKVRAVISEGYLGKPIDRMSDKEISAQIDELSQLYIESFEVFKKILSGNGRVVITLPVFVSGKNYRWLPIFDSILSLGFQPQLQFPSNTKKCGVLEITGRGSVIYGRPDQRVYREISVWQKI